MKIKTLEEKYLTQDEFNAALDAIDEEFEQAVAEGPEVWDFENEGIHAPGWVEGDIYSGTDDDGGDF